MRQGASLVVSGIDGDRDVRLTLDVGITQAKDSCRLEWIVADPQSGHPKGDIESVTGIHSSNQSKMNIL